jgi:integrase/recombinase XerD
MLSRGRGTAPLQAFGPLNTQRVCNTSVFLSHPSSALALRAQYGNPSRSQSKWPLMTRLLREPHDPEADNQPDLLGLRDRALIAIMVYSFARIGAVIQMKVGDYFVQGRRRWVRLHEKGGKEHDVPCHHRLDQCLHDYIEAAGITDDVDGYLFRTARRKTGQLTTNPLFQQDAHRIIRRRAKAAGIETRIGNHTFRATGITACLKNSGKLEVAQQIANHESPRTTKLYDRRQDEISLDEIERITI